MSRKAQLTAFTLSISHIHIISIWQGRRIRSNFLYDNQVQISPRLLHNNILEKMIATCPRAPQRPLDMLWNSPVELSSGPLSTRFPMPFLHFMGKCNIVFPLFHSQSLDTICLIPRLVRSLKLAMRR
ncbi:hypothetical protein ACFX15_014324 [Malus domestica]